MSGQQNQNQGWIDKRLAAQIKRQQERDQQRAAGAAATLPTGPTGGVPAVPAVPQGTTYPPPAGAGTGVGAGAGAPQHFNPQLHAQHAPQFPPNPHYAPSAPMNHNPHAYGHAAPGAHSVPMMPQQYAPHQHQHPHPHQHQYPHQHQHQQQYAQHQYAQHQQITTIPYTGVLNAGPPQPFPAYAPGPPQHAPHFNSLAPNVQQHQITTIPYNTQPHNTSQYYGPR